MNSANQFNLGFVGLSFGKPNPPEEIKQQQPQEVSEVIPPPVVEKKPSPQNQNEETTMATAFHKRDYTFFENKFSELEFRLEFNPEWMDVEETFKPLATQEKFRNLVKPGQVFFSIESEGKRNLIIVGTAAGPVVIYQRYPNGNTAVNFNAPELLMRCGLFRSNGRISSDDLVFALGNEERGTIFTHNIGKSLAQLVSALSN